MWASLSVQHQGYKRRQAGDGDVDADGDGDASETCGRWKMGGAGWKTMACRQALDSVTFARKAATMQRPGKLIVIAIERVTE